MKHKKILIIIIVFIGLLFSIKNVHANALEQQAIDDAKQRLGKTNPNYYVLKASCEEIKENSRELLGETSKLKAYRIQYQYLVYITYTPTGLLNPQEMTYNGIFYNNKLEYTSSDDDKSSATQQDNLDGENPYYDSEETEIKPAPTMTDVTINATKMTYKMDKFGTYWINIEFDKPIEVKQAPILKVKIGDDPARKLSYYACDKNNSLTYKMIINNTADCGKNIVLDSITGGNVKCAQENTNTIAVDYTSNLTNKNIGEIGNFILIFNDEVADINKDRRIDALDIEALEKNKIDINGDKLINDNDVNDLREAVNKRNILYISYLKVSDYTYKENGQIKQQIKGDANGDGIINYRDANLNTVDVNGDGIINGKDKAFIISAIKSKNPSFCLYIKISSDNYADLNNDGIINVEDLFLIKGNSNADINRDRKVDLRDQIAMSQILYTGNLEKIRYFTVFKGAQGDVNKDGFIDYYDAQAIANYIVSGEGLRKQMDANGDGIIDIYDAILILEALEEKNNTCEKRMQLLSNSYYIDAEKNPKCDINGDGYIDYYDVKAIADSLVGGNEQLSIEKGDINGDNKVDVLDATAIATILNDFDYQVDAYTKEEMEDSNEIDFEYKIGDVNSDGIVNVADVVDLNYYLMNQQKYPLTEAQLKAADVTKNGEVDITDSTLLMNYVAMIIDYNQLGG